MTNSYFNSSNKDTDGRNLILSDSIKHIKYYDSTNESWDKSGALGQSWLNEVYSPNDIFDETDVNNSRWEAIGSVGITSNMVADVTSKEGSSYLTSEGKWGLSGDFEIYLYIDWESYYNEYRGITHSFFSVRYDASNAVRISFSFDGTSSYSFVSETAAGKSIQYFDWSSNGARLEVLDIASATQYTHFKITRQAGVIRTYISTGVADTQVGDDVGDALLQDTVHVRFGVQNKEYNTYKHGFSKFFVKEGATEESLEFFSSTRGRSTNFPDKVIAVVEKNSVSLVDETSSKLWMRFMLGDVAGLVDDTIRLDFCEGVMWCSTSVGALAYDFTLDKIFRYSGNEIQVADEPISLRNAGLTFRTYLASSGVMPSDDIRDIGCAVIGSEVYVAMAHTSGVSIKRQLSEGISNCADGPAPGTRIAITDKGSLFWSGYDDSLGEGELSYFTNVTSLAVTGTTTFSRSGFYGTNTALSILGENISSFDIRVVENKHTIAVSTSEGITFISELENYSSTYGVQSLSSNPFNDPTFTSYIGEAWVPFHTGFIRAVNIIRNTAWKTTDTHSLLIGFFDLPSSSYLLPGIEAGVYQDVDMTGVDFIYFDVNLTGTSVSVWEFQITVGGQVIKMYNNTDGSFIRLADSASTSEFTGVQRVELKLSVPSKVTSDVDLTSNVLMLDNIRTTIGSPKYRILPPGEASVIEVLLQHDLSDKKIYFASLNGFGAIDIQSNSLDYFKPIEVSAPESAVVTSGEFVRLQSED